MSIFRPLSHGIHLTTAMRNGIVRSFLTNLKPRQLQKILPSGSEVFKKWMRERQVGPTIYNEDNTEMLEDGESMLFWVGKQDISASVILFFHGGGYVLPLSRGHLEWANYLCSVASKTGRTASVALLDYSLCPENVYPKQMRQAAIALKRLISMGYSPSRIVIGGDSAGGHLALSLLSYLMHQYQDDNVFEKALSEPLAGCFLVSPLLSLDLDTRSYQENQHVDLLSIPIIRDWGEDLFRGSPFQSEKQMGGAWGMALSGDESWWASLGKVVKNVYLVGGSEEMFRDHIIEYGERLTNVAGVDVRTYIDAKEAHDGTFMEFETGAALSKSTKRLGRWIIESLSLPKSSK